MTDLISRQEAIDALREIEFSLLMGGEDSKEVRLIRAEKAQDTIEQLPSAQPKKGKWKEQAIENVKAAGIEEVQVAKCSACGLYHTTPYMYYFTEYKYCPNCGARMVSEDE